MTLARLVSLVCLRWWVEDDFQDGKEIWHLDKGQVTCWNSWHRWSVITMVAYAFLATAAALERAAQTGLDDPAEADLVPRSSHELLRLLRALILPAAPTRPRPPSVVVHLAPPPSTPRPPLPPPLARVRRHHTVIRKLSSGYLQLPYLFRIFALPKPRQDTWGLPINNSSVSAGLGRRVRVCRRGSR